MSDFDSDLHKRLLAAATGERKLVSMAELRIKEKARETFDLR
jgi:hypothetical protein